MAERRFDDDEIREILTRATELRPETPGLPSGTSGHGLTLSELEDAAAEAGIPPARVVEAAASLERDRSVLPPPRRYLGVPISAGHAVRLPRMLDDAEWDRFVVRLRDTFGATGEVRTEGSLQTWSNGNLKVLLEPLEEGARLRFQSLHDASKQFLDGGVATTVSGGVMVTLLAGLSFLVGKPIPMGLMALSAGFLPLGAALWAMGRHRARAWLPTRARQFEALGAEARRVVGPGSAGAHAED